MLARQRVGGSVRDVSSLCNAKDGDWCCCRTAGSWWRMLLVPGSRKKSCVPNRLSSF